MDDWTFDVVAGPFGCTAEGPAWDGRFLYFTLIEKSLIVRFDPRNGETHEWRKDTCRTNGLMFDIDGQLFGCSIAKQAIVRFEPDGTMTTVANGINGVRFNTPNDLAIDSKGRIWFSNPWNAPVALPGQVRGTEQDSAVLLDPGSNGVWTATVASTDLSCPNGMLISRDERTMYVSQCDYRIEKPRELRAYEILASGELGRYTVLHTWGQDYRGVHRPIDGMCLDADGNIVATAGWDKSGPGSMIYVFSPTGRILETHPCAPTDRLTNCTFGDDDLQSLYVTTGGQSPDAGKLLRVRTKRKGWCLWPGNR